MTNAYDNGPYDLNVGHCKEMLEYKNGQVAIHPKHTKLITALRTAVEW
jgi:hypothetical protein